MRRPHSLSSLRLLRLCSVQANDTCILTPVSSACSHAQTERDGDQQGVQVGVFFFFFCLGTSNTRGVEREMKRNVCKLFAGPA